ncbi:Protein kinase [Zostera marina]|uniref:non-specific serine/threonine protein kinase n=1 Tax=Zostera marina TaxID=29655 RepID=A0A0K9PLV6_ZOSMR|nr:Protein kinase [Zostera marina]
MEWTRLHSNQETAYHRTLYFTHLCRVVVFRMVQITSIKNRICRRRSIKGRELMGICIGCVRSCSSVADKDGVKMSNSEMSEGSFVSRSAVATTLSSTEESSKNSDDLYMNGKILPDPNLRVFTLAEMKAATNNFKMETMLGEGGFGTVYKGWIDEKSSNSSIPKHNMVVAVKKLNVESVQGFKEWKSEVNFLGRLSHPNLVKLLGYCWEEELILVYNYMSKGSLDTHLFRGGSNSNMESISWELRVKIAIDVARGLAFLHSSDIQLIFRDFKTSNILLDSNYNAKLSDFGLAKPGPIAGNSHVTTQIIGTYGYVAPEYVSTGHLYLKSDVYGFGAVLLEILSGRCAMDTNRSIHWIEYAKPRLCDPRKCNSIMDKRLEGKYPSKAAVQACELCRKCLTVDHKSRPSMTEVLETLEEIKSVKGSSYIPNRKHGRTPIHHTRDVIRRTQPKPKPKPKPKLQSPPQPWPLPTPNSIISK